MGEGLTLENSVYPLMDIFEESIVLIFQFARILKMKTLWSTLRGLERCCMKGDKYHVASSSYVLYHWKY